MGLRNQAADQLYVWWSTCVLSFFPIYHSSFYYESPSLDLRLNKKDRCQSLEFISIGCLFESVYLPFNILLPRCRCARVGRWCPMYLVALPTTREAFPFSNRTGIPNLGSQHSSPLTSFLRWTSHQINRYRGGWRLPSESSSRQYAINKVLIGSDSKDWLNLLVWVRKIWVRSDSSLHWSLPDRGSVNHWAAMRCREGQTWAPFGGNRFLITRLLPAPEEKSTDYRVESIE